MDRGFCQLMPLPALTSSNSMLPSFSAAPCARPPQEDEFVTCSGKKVALRIFVNEHNIGRVDFAMQSLKRSMK